MGHQPSRKDLDVALRIGEQLQLGRSRFAADLVHSGPGACSKSGCNCQGYEGNASTCGNSGCGHSWSDHW